jgi:uncharacterized protein (DUF2147 family)
MKAVRIIFLAILTTTLILGSSALADAKSPVGIWKTIDDETSKAKSHVEIFEKNGKLYGKITKLLNDDPEKLCTACKGKRHNQKIVGMTIMWDLEKDDDEWDDGEILDPKNGKIYDCKIWREGNTLKVRGYIAFFFRTQTWHLVEQK